MARLYVVALRELEAPHIRILRCVVEAKAVASGPGWIGALKSNLRSEFPIIRTLIYLKLSVSGHLTIFVTRTRGPLWTRPAPSGLLLGAVLGTQAIATLIAISGTLMTPLPWRWAALVWGYALFWFLLEDRVKLATYRWLDRHPDRPTPTRMPPTWPQGPASHDVTAK